MSASEQEILQVVQIFQAAANVHDPSEIERVTRFFAEHAANTQFNLCLTIIAATPGQFPDVIRQQSALKLKNNITCHYAQAVAPNLDFIKGKLLECLSDKCQPVKNAIASCISEIAKTGNWPDLAATLWPRLVASPPGERTGILVCIKDVCEDCAPQLELRNASQQTQADIIIPGLIKLLAETQDPLEMRYVLESIFALLDSEAANNADSRIAAAFGELLTELYPGLERAVQCSDQAPPSTAEEIKVATMRCYRLLLYYYDQMKQLGKFENTLNIIHHHTNSASPAVALAACEFWSDMAAKYEAIMDITNAGLLHLLLEQLLDKMVYSEIEVEMLADEEAREDVNPRRYQQRRRGGSDEEDEDVEQWNLRRCAAATLDAMSSSLGTGLMTPPGQEPNWFLTKQIMPRMQHSDWKVQEAAVLALGAIAYGCYTALKDRLLEIIPVLLQVLSQPNMHYLVQAITCWTTSRFCSFIVNYEDPTVLFDKFLSLLLVRMTDSRRKVQECAVSAFSVLVEESQELICTGVYLDQICQKLAECLQPKRYTTRNLVILLDAVGQLSYYSGQQLATPQWSTHIYDPIFNVMLQQCKEDDALMPHLLKCAGFALTGLNQSFAPYVPNIFNKCLHIAGKYYEQQFQLIHNPAGEPGDATIMLNVSDVLSRILTSMEARMQDLEQMMFKTTFPGTEFTIYQLMLLPFSKPELNCDALALMASMVVLGESMKYFGHHLVKPTVAVVENILVNVNDDTALCSDTCYCLGELILAAQSQIPQEQLTQMAGQVANKLIPVLTEHEDWHDNLLQTCSIAVGRLALVLPGMLAPQAGSFIKPLLVNLGQVMANSQEKEQGLQGVIELLKGNFGLLQDPSTLQALLLCMHSFRNQMSSDLQQSCIALLKALKEASGGQWANIMKLFPPAFSGSILASL